MTSQKGNNKDNRKSKGNGKGWVPGHDGLIVVGAPEALSEVVHVCQVLNQSGAGGLPA